MQKKKVLVLTTTFPRWKNDTTPSFIYDLSKNLSSKYRIIVLAPHHNGAEKHEFRDNIEIIRFVYFKPETLQKLCYGGGILPNMKGSLLATIQMPFLIFSEFFTSYKIISKFEIEMIHAHWVLPQGFVSVFLKKIFKMPVIVTIHGSDLFPLKNWLFRSMQEFVVKNVDSVTVNSPAARNELIKRFPYYKNKIQIIPMGIDTNLFKKRAIRKPSKYSNDRLLLFVGRLSDQKGLQYLIDAMPHIIKDEPAAKLLIVGEGSYKKTLNEMIISRNLTMNVEFIGPLAHDDTSYYYNIADIFVMPSLSNKTGTESLGLALLEAMASGCAVIGTRVGGIPYTIKDGYNGLLIEQKNSNELSKAIINLLQDKKKSERMGKNAARIVRKKYSWEKVSQEFMKIYKKMV